MAFISIMVLFETSIDILSPLTLVLIIIKHINLYYKQTTLLIFMVDLDIVKQILKFIQNRLLKR